MLCLYVTFLAKNGLSSSTIQSYLSALWYLHISLGLPELDVGSMAKLKFVVRGIRRLKGKDFNGKRRLPISLVPRLFFFLLCLLEHEKQVAETRREREYLHACLRKRKAWCLIIADTAIN